MRITNPDGTKTTYNATSTDGKAYIYYALSNTDTYYYKYLSNNITLAYRSFSESDADGIISNDKLTEVDADIPIIIFTGIAYASTNIKYTIVGVTSGTGYAFGTDDGDGSSAALIPTLRRGDVISIEKNE